MQPGPNCDQSHNCQQHWRTITERSNANAPIGVTCKLKHKLTGQYIQRVKANDSNTRQSKYSKCKNVTIQLLSKLLKSGMRKMCISWKRKLHIYSLGSNCLRTNTQYRVNMYSTCIPLGGSDTVQYNVEKFGNSWLVEWGSFNPAEGVITSLRHLIPCEMRLGNLFPDFWTDVLSTMVSSFNQSAAKLAW